MEEQLILFKTAKLAKEKGFNFNVLNCYSENEELGDVECHLLHNFNNHKTIKGSNTNLYSAPTQSSLQRWLREIHMIHIVSKPFYDAHEHKTTYVSDIISIKHPNRIIKSPRCDSYEEALEYALEKALNLIEE